jgi:hypothetical protein
VRSTPTSRAKRRTDVRWAPFLPFSLSPLLFVGNGDGFGNGFHRALGFDGVEGHDRGIFAEDVAYFDMNLGNCASGGCGDLDRGFLGLDLDQALVDLDDVADGHQNGNHIDTVNAFAELGQSDGYSHRSLLRP